jgi:hypothetical protein
MADPIVIMVKGADGEPPGDPVDGKPAPPLIDGNGDPGKASGKTCTQRATNGHAGNGGGPAPPALKGASGLAVPRVTMSVTSIEAASRLTVSVSGGDGARGVAGGRGGDGGPGGDAGKQPTACAKKYGDTIGGLGGHAGTGGDAGDGGDAGSGGIASLVWDAGLGSDFRPSLTSTAGKVGRPGEPGNPGDPGEGGLNGDGKTRNHDGGTGDPGGIGQFGRQGRSGTASMGAVTNPSVQVLLVVVPQTSVGA